VTLHGKDLYSEVAWRKFLAATPLSGQTLCSLIEGTEEITRRYRSFLLTAYTRRYRTLVQPEQRRWFHQVTRLVVVRRIMESKYQLQVTRQQATFADLWVGQEMGTLMDLNLLTTEIAKAIHHIVKEPKEHAQYLIEQLYQVHAQHIRIHAHRPADPLPPLPAGTSAVLLLAGALEQDDLEEQTHAE
jgi:hypothetical protein